MLAHRSALLAAVVGLWTTAASGQTSAPNRPTPEFRLVLWFRSDDPVATFRSKAYDLRHGPLPPAVDDWIQLIRTRYPRYIVTTRDVVLADHPGSTEAERLAAAIATERRGALDRFLTAELEMARLQLRLSRPDPIDSGPDALVTHRYRALRPVPNGPPGASRPYPTPSYSFPVPVPYPRPHP